MGRTGSGTPRFEPRDEPGFYRATLGFTIAYDRPAARFAYLERGAAQLMLCERNGRWETGDMRYPLRRGINLQISVPDIEPIETALTAAGIAPFEPASDRSYRVGHSVAAQREILVQDPDGYLLRFVAVISPADSTDALA